VSTAAQPTAASSSGYSVARAAGKCAVSGRAIAAGEKYIAALRESPAGLERLDISPEHWDAFDRAHLLAFWPATMRPTAAKPKMFVDDGVLCDLFERLSEVTEPAKRNFRFVLGLSLVRKRLLIYDATRMDGEREIWTVRLKGREEPMPLWNPRLNEQQVAEVSTQLGEILSGDQ
jgi:hypothetical protein